MIAVVLALQLSAVTYDNVPPEVVRVSVYEWSDEASPRPVAADVGRQGPRVLLRSAPGRRVVLNCRLKWL